MKDYKLTNEKLREDLRDPMKYRHAKNRLGPLGEALLKAVEDQDHPPKGVDKKDNRR